MKKTFSIEIKEEILFKKRSKNEEKEFLKGIYFSLFRAENEEIVFLIKNKKIKDEIIKKIYRVFKSIKNFSAININIPIKSASDFFAGIFVISGSISPIYSSSYHFQFCFNNKDIATKIQEKLANNDLYFSLIKKNKKWILYIKKNELISDFLKFIGALKCFFKFADNMIERDYSNQLNRISNLDIHNQNKLVDSHEIFKDYYEIVKNNNLLWHFSQNEILFYEFKLKNSFLPLSQLCINFEQESGIKRTKSGLNHWLIKLRKIVENFEAN